MTLVCFHCIVQSEEDILRFQVEAQEAYMCKQIIGLCQCGEIVCRGVNEPREVVTASGHIDELEEVGEEFTVFFRSSLVRALMVAENLSAASVMMSSASLSVVMEMMVKS